MPLIGLLMLGKGWLTVAGMVLSILGSVLPLVGVDEQTANTIRDSGLAIGGVGVARKAAVGK